MVIDTSGEVVFWNQAMEELTGVNSEDMIGKWNYEYALPFYGERRPMLLDFALKPDPIKERSYTFFERKGHTLIAENYINLLRGKRRYIRAQASPLFSLKGEIVGAIETFHDLTDSKTSEASLRDSEERMRTLIDQSPMSIQIFAEDGHLVDGNRASEELWKTPVIHLLGQYNILEDELVKENGTYDHIQKVLNGETIDTSKPVT